MIVNAGEKSNVGQLAWPNLKKLDAGCHAGKRKDLPINQSRQTFSKIIY